MMPGSPVNAASFRDSRNLALARLSELGAPFLKLAARLSSSQHPGPPSSWRRGIILGADHIGDVLYNTASLPILAESFPRCEWHFVGSAAGAEILANNPFIKSCVRSPESLGPIDVALCYNSGGYWRELVRAVRRGIPNRVGYVHKGFSALVTHPVRIEFPQPFPAYFRSMVAQLAGKEPSWSLRPKVFPGPRDGERADELWRECALESRRPVLACFVTSRQARGVWPATQFAAAIRAIEKDPDVQTVLMGSEEDRHLLDELKQRFALKARLAGGTLSLLPLVRFLEKCTAVFCTRLRAASPRQCRQSSTRLHSQYLVQQGRGEQVLRDGGRPRAGGRVRLARRSSPSVRANRCRIGRRESFRGRSPALAWREAPGSVLVTARPLSGRENHNRSSSRRNADRSEAR